MMKRAFVRGVLPILLVVLAFLAIALLPNVSRALSDDGDPTDLDNDGVPDQVDTEPDPPGPMPGNVTIYSGVDGSIVARISGIQYHDQFGNSVAGVGDANGDGFGDVLVGAPNADDGLGRAYVFYGPPVRNGSNTFDASAADIVLTSPYDDDYAFGELVAPLYDLSGDGLPEMRVLSSVVLPSGMLSTRTYVYSGADGALLSVSFGSMSNAAWDILLGDLNDDGLVDASDLALLESRFGMVGDLDVFDGDLNDDGVIDTEDLLIAEANLGSSVFEIDLAAATNCNYWEWDGNCRLHFVCDAAGVPIFVGKRCTGVGGPIGELPLPPGIGGGGGSGGGSDEPITTPGGGGGFFGDPPPGEPGLPPGGVTCFGAEYCFVAEDVCDGEAITFSITPAGHAEFTTGGSQITVQPGTTVCFTVHGIGAYSIHAEQGDCEATRYSNSIRVDLSIDSANRLGFDVPEDQDDEEAIEDDPALPGKVIIINNGDSDGDGIPDFADGFNLDTDPEHLDDDTSPNDRFVPVRIKVSGPVDWSGCFVEIAYSFSDPSQVVFYDSGFVPSYETAIDGELRLWKKDGAEARNAASITAGGDFVPNGQFPLSMFGVGSEGGEFVLWLEALDPSVQIASHMLSVSSSLGCPDSVRVSAIGSRFVQIRPDEEEDDDDDESTIVSLDPNVYGQNAGADTLPQVSTPSPVLTLTQFSITDVLPSSDDSQVEGVIRVTGTVTDALRNLRPNQDGAVSYLALYLNDEGVAVGEGAQGIPVQWSAASEPATVNQPYRYVGTFDITLSTNALQPGYNTLKVLADNDLGFTGFAEQSFIITATAPPDQYVRYNITFDGDPYFGESATLEFIHNGTVVGPIQLESLKPGTYRSFAQGIVVEITNPDLVIDPDEADSFFVNLTLADFEIDDEPSWAGETGPNTLSFDGELTITQAMRPDWRGFAFGVEAVSEVVTSSGGDFFPFFIELLGPADLLQSATQIEVQAQNCVTKFVQEQVFVAEAATNKLKVYVITRVVDHVVSQTVAERRDGIDSFVEGFGAGLCDTGIALYDDSEAICTAAWHMVKHYNMITLAYKWAANEMPIPLEDAHRIAVTSVRAHQIWNVASEIIENQSELIFAALTGDVDAADQLGEQHRMLMEAVVELWGVAHAAAVQYLQDIDDFELGRIIGRITGEVLVEVTVAIITDGAGNLIKKSELIGKILTKVNQPGIGLPEPVVVAINQLAELVVDLTTTKMCFVAGTLVHTASGLTPIEQVQVGDLVLSRDPQTGEQGYKAVSETFVTHPDSLVRIEYSIEQSTAAASMLEPCAIECTGEHPFYVVERGDFVPAMLLKVGDTFSLSDEISTAHVTDVSVERGPPNSTTETTYNFEVQDWHTYFVDASGVWVHNKGPACERAFSIIARIKKDVPGIGHWDAFELYLLRTTTPARRAATDPAMTGTVRFLMEATFKDAILPDGTIDISKVKSVQQIGAFRNLAVATDRLPGDVFHNHHVVPQEWARRLYKRMHGIEPPQSWLDDMPGCLLEMHDHVPDGYGTRNLHDLIESVFLETPPDSLDDVSAIMENIKEGYRRWDPEFGPNLWKAGERWLIEEGVVP